MTYTYIEMPVSAAVFKEIKEKLEAAGYHHAIDDDGKALDMHGIALVEQK